MIVIGEYISKYRSFTPSLTSPLLLFFFFWGGRCVVMIIYSYISFLCPSYSFSSIFLLYISWYFPLSFLSSRPNIILNVLLSSLQAGVIGKRILGVNVQHPTVLVWIWRPSQRTVPRLPRHYKTFRRRKMGQWSTQGHTYKVLWLCRWQLNRFWWF